MHDTHYLNIENWSEAFKSAQKMFRTTSYDV